MSLIKVISVKISHMQRVSGAWCMLIETGADVAWSIRDQSWHVRHNVWVSLNETFPKSLREFVVHSEEDMLTAMGVPLPALLSRSTYMTYTQCVTGCLEDINVGLGWYKLKTCLELSFSVNPAHGKEFILSGTGIDKSVFFRIASNDVKDILFKSTMRVAPVKRIDLWQRMLADPFATFPSEHILSRTACIASHSPSFLHFLRFLSGTRIKHSPDFPTFVLNAWAIFTIQKHTKAFVWRPQSRLVAMQMEGANKSGGIFNGHPNGKANIGNRAIDDVVWRRCSESAKTGDVETPSRQRWGCSHVPPRQRSDNGVVG